MHRLVLAREFGHPLPPEVTAHHKNGIRSDNRRENLQTRYGNHGKGVAAKCGACGSEDIEFVDLVGAEDEPEALAST